MEALLVTACETLHLTLSRRDSVHFDGNQLSESGVQIVLATILEAQNPTWRIVDEYQLDTTHFPDLALFHPDTGALVALIELKFVRLGFVNGARGAPTAGNRLERAGRLGHLRLLIRRQTWAETGRLEYAPPPPATGMVAIQTVLDAGAVPQLRAYAARVPAGRPPPLLAALILVGERPFLFAVTDTAVYELPLHSAATLAPTPSLAPVPVAVSAVCLRCRATFVRNRQQPRDTCRRCKRPKSSSAAPGIMDLTE
jgi:hypothetical protein